MEFLFRVAFASFLSSWMFYPAILFLLSAVRRKYDGNWRNPETWPSVSVLVAARNERDVIGPRIENLLAQNYDGNIQVIVGSDCSDDGTDRVVLSYADRGVMLHRSERRLGKPRMMGELIGYATGEILVFTDADTVFADDTVKELVKPFSFPRVGCVDGNRRNSLDDETCESIYWKYEKKIKSLCSGMGAVLGATGAVFSIRKELYSPLAPGRGDDFELAVMVRLRGFDCVFNPDAVAMEPSPDDARQYRRMVRIVSWMMISCLMLMGKAAAKGKFFLFIQLLFHKMFRWLSGFFLLAATAAAGFLASSSPAFLVIFILLSLFHATAAAGALLRERLPSKLLFPYYFWLMNAAAMDGILRTLAGRPVETWEKRKKQPDES